MVNVKSKCNCVETLRKFTMGKLSIRKLRSSSVLMIMQCIIISADQDPSLRIESFAIKNLRGVSTKLYFNGGYVVAKYIIILFICILSSDWSIYLPGAAEPGGALGGKAPPTL